MIMIRCVPDAGLSDSIAGLLSRHSRHLKVSTAACRLVKIARNTSAWRRAGRSWGVVELQLAGQWFGVHEIPGLEAAIQSDSHYRTKGQPDTTAALEAFIQTRLVRSVAVPANGTHSALKFTAPALRVLRTQAGDEEIFL